MEVKRSGSQPSGKGPAEYFTGTVRIDPLFQAHEPARVLGASVTFEAGARTAWHTHPLGQNLIVTAGRGPTATTAMTHIAIQEHLNGKAADWMEKVTDDQYRAAERKG